MTRSYSSGTGGGQGPFEFDLDGVQFVATGGVTLLDMSELMTVADLDADSPRGAAALAQMFRAALGDDEYARFREHCRRHDTQPEVIITIMRDLADYVMGPTMRRVGQSSPGPSSTSGSSPVDLPSSGDQFSPQDMARLRAILANGSVTSSPGWPPVTP
jgi:hypothetical protein